MVDKDKIIENLTNENKALIKMIDELEAERHFLLKEKEVKDNLVDSLERSFIVFKTEMNNILKK